MTVGLLVMLCPVVSYGIIISGVQRNQAGGMGMKSLKGEAIFKTDT